VVGQRIGDHINNHYETALRSENLTREQVVQVPADLEKAHQGRFLYIGQDDEKIVFGNRICPFEEKVIYQSSPLS